MVLGARTWDLETAQQKLLLSMHRELQPEQHSPCGQGHCQEQKPPQVISS